MQTQFSYRSVRKCLIHREQLEPELLLCAGGGTLQYMSSSTCRGGGTLQYMSWRRHSTVHVVEYMSSNSIRLYNSPVSRVLVKGLQKKLQYNGIEGVVVEMDALRMRVGLDTLNNKELMLKPENVCPLFSTALKLQEQLMKMHDLAQEPISSSQQVRRIPINADPGRQDSTSCW